MGADLIIDIWTKRWPRRLGAIVTDCSNMSVIPINRLRPHSSTKLHLFKLTDSVFLQVESAARGLIPQRLVPEIIGMAGSCSIAARYM